MGSSRLPGKVLKEICGKPMIGWVAERAARSKLIDQVLIATTESPDDDPIQWFCEKSNLTCFRGNEFDVLDRYYQAAKKADAEIIVRLTADCPLIDPTLIDETIEALLNGQMDFTANRLPPPYHRTYPIGQDVEVATFVALESAWKKAEALYEREHVMPYLYDPKNGLKSVILDYKIDLGTYRWTVDTPEDLEFIRQLTSLLKCKDEFTWLDVVKILDKNPELVRINADITHKKLKEVDGRANSK